MKNRVWCAALAILPFMLHPAQAAPARSEVWLSNFLDHSARTDQEIRQNQDKLDKRCSKNSAMECIMLGTYFLGRNDDSIRDNEKAGEYYLKACKSDRATCSYLGKLYDEGGVVGRDRRLANELFEISCKAGSLAGCGRLAMNYVGGNGTAQDLNKAYSLFMKACNNFKGNDVSCFNLGLCYENGMWGAPKNPSKAAEYFARACKRGYKKGCDAARKMAN